MFWTLVFTAVMVISAAEYTKATMDITFLAQCDEPLQYKTSIAVML